MSVLVAGLLVPVAGCKRPAEHHDEPGPTRTVEPVPANEPVPAAAAPEPAAAAPVAAPAAIHGHVRRVPSGGAAPVAAPAVPAAPAAPATTSDYGPVSTELRDPPAELASTLTLERLASGLSRPVGLEHAPGDMTGRLFIVEQHVARIRILRGGKVEPEPFFDMRGKVARGNEQGLLGLAFHPRFIDNRRLYINYTDREGTTRIVEYKVAADDPDRVDMSTARELLAIEQPYSNHNAGYLQFGKDGKLYVGTGDGGAAGDPLNAAQDPQNLLGKMLRLDVEAGATRAKPEIIQLGLRNPWRYHFDSRTGDLYIGDVGQNRYEFVHVVAGDDLEGHNFGWNVVEGNRCYKTKRCDTSRFTPAAIVYDHDTGCSITGGLVYRGKAIPELDGVYFYADYCTAIVRSFRWAKDGVRQHWRWNAALDPQARLRDISAFGSDADGELYLLSLQGSIYKLVRKSGT